MQESSAKRFLSRYGFWIVTLIALGFRLAYLAYYAQLPDWELLTVDNYYHHHWAETIANGNIVGDTTYFRAPLYVWCLGALYSVFGSTWWVGRLFGVLIGSAATGMTWMLARRLFSPSVALLAALIHACYPIAVYHDGELLTDSLFTLTLQIALYCSLRWFDDKNPRSALWAGLALGLSALARPTALVFIPLIIIFALWEIRNRFRYLQQTGVFLSGVLLVVSITFIRNLIVAHDPVLVASQGGINFYIGNNAESDGVSASMPLPLGNTWQMAEVKYIAEHNEGRALTQGEISSYWFSQGMQWICDNPVTFLQQYSIKLYRQIANFEIPNQRDLNQFLHKLPFPFDNPLCFGFLFSFAVWGIVISWRTNRQVRFLVWSALVYMLATALFFVTSRFRLPILPIFFAFGAYGIISLLWHIRTKSRYAVAGSICILIAGFLSFFPFFSLPHRTTVQAELAQSSLALSERRYADAVSYAQQAVHISDTAMNAHLILGIAHLRMGNADSAIAQLETETRLYPENEKGYINLASAYLASENTAKAAYCIRVALTLTPYDATANQLLIRGAAKDSTTMNETVIAISDSAALRTGYDPAVVADAAALLVQHDQYASAEAMLRRSLETAPPAIETDDAAFERNFIHSPGNLRLKKAQVYFQLGFIAGLQQRYEEAISFTRSAIANDASMRDAYLNLITAYISTHQLQRADSVLQDAQSRFPGDPRLSKQLRIPRQ